jgi:hypothetical protein
MATTDKPPKANSDFHERFGNLLKMARILPKPKEPALVPVLGQQSKLTCEGFTAGKDVELVLVRAKSGEDGKALAVLETLTYRKDVAGSDLVYDLTGEFLQGKARPFDCDLRKQPQRLYALLPFQVEKLAVVAGKPSDKVSFAAEFQNALGQRVRGALPCYAELRMPSGKVVWERYLTSGPSGGLGGREATAGLPSDAPRGKWSLIVRSMLDGSEVTLPIEVGGTAVK